MIIRRKFEEVYVSLTLTHFRLSHLHIHHSEMALEEEPKISTPMSSSEFGRLFLTGCKLCG